MAISCMFKSMILSALLFMPRDGLTKEAAPDQNPPPSVENDSSKDDQDSSQGSSDEGEPSPTSPPMPPKEDPVILKEVEDKNPQEGIGDAFSKDQGDRFQSKNTNKKVEFSPSE